MSDGDDGAGAGAGPGAGAGASAYGVGGAGASAAGTSVSSVSAAITVWLCLSAAAKLCNYVRRWIGRFAAVFYVQNDCGLSVLPRETVCRAGLYAKPRSFGQQARRHSSECRNRRSPRQEASEACRNTPAQHKIATKPVALELLCGRSRALKVSAAGSLVAATRFQQLVSLLRPSAARFVSKRSCCSQRERIHQGEPG